MHGRCIRTSAAGSASRVQVRTGGGHLDQVYLDRCERCRIETSMRLPPAEQLQVLVTAWAARELLRTRDSFRPCDHVGHVSLVCLLDMMSQPAASLGGATYG